MSEPAAATALAPEPPCTDDLLRLAIDELRACRARVEEGIAGRGPLTELMAGWHRLADLQDQLRQVAMSRTLADVLAAAEPEPEPVRHHARVLRQRGRHAAARPLRALPPAAFLPAGAAAFKWRLPFPSLHALAAHKAVLLTAGASSAVAVTALASMQPAHMLPFDTTTGPGSWHAPAAVPFSAVPITFPSSPRPTAYVSPVPPGKHHKPVPAVVLTVTPPPQVPAFSSPVSSDPSPSSGSSDPSLSPDLSPSSVPSGDDGTGGGGGDGSKQERKQERKLDKQLGDATDTVTGDLSGHDSGNQDGGTGRHRGRDGTFDASSGYAGQHSDSGRSHGGNRQGSQQQDGSQQGASWQGGSQQQGGHDGGHGRHGGQQG